MTVVPRAAEEIADDIKQIEGRVKYATKCMEHYMVRFPVRGPFYCAVMESFYTFHVMLRTATEEMELRTQLDKAIALSGDACVYITLNQFRHGNFESILRIIADMATEL